MRFRSKDDTVGQVWSQETAVPTARAVPKGGRVGIVAVLHYGCSIAPAGTGCSHSLHVLRAVRDACVDRQQQQQSVVAPCLTGRVKAH